MSGGKATIHHGDALEVLRGMEGGLPRAVCPLSMHVARVAKRYEVGEPVRFDVSVEVPERRDVMYIELLAVAVFAYAAILAGVVVTPPGAPSLAVPVVAVIAVVSTTPCWVVWAAPVCIAAFQTAKRYPALSLSAPVGVVEDFTAMFAGHPVINALSLWASCRFNQRTLSFLAVLIGFGDFATDDPHRTSPVEALPGTHIGVLGSFDLGLCPLKRLAAHWAVKLNARLEFLSAKLVGAVTGTCGLASMLQPCCVCHIDSFADGTRPFDRSSHDFLIVPQKCFMGTSWDEYVEYAEARIHGDGPLLNAVRVAGGLTDDGRS